MNKFIDFLNGGNTIKISGVKDFQIMRTLCKKVGIRFFEKAFWKKPDDPNAIANYYDLLELAQFNNGVINYSTILIEYTVGKGLTFGWKSYKESEEWFGKKPYSATEVKRSVDSFEVIY